MADAGLIVLTAFISPFRAERDMVRAMMAEGEFFEIFVDTPLEQAEQRDTKGLYAKARAGELANFTGIDSPYEPPLAPDVRIIAATNADPVEAVRHPHRTGGEGDGQAREDISTGRTGRPTSSGYRRARTISHAISHPNWKFTRLSSMDHDWFVAMKMPSFVSPMICPRALLRKYARPTSYAIDFARHSSSVTLTFFAPHISSAFRYQPTTVRQSGALKVPARMTGVVC